MLAMGADHGTGRRGRGKTRAPGSAVTEGSELANRTFVGRGEVRLASAVTREGLKGSLPSSPKPPALALQARSGSGGMGWAGA